MDEMPTMKEWRRLHAAGQLTGPPAIFFQPTKPVEELYDTAADPHEIHNLADQLEHQTTLQRLRSAHEKWRQDTGDLGLIPEPELLERIRPGGQWSTTANPRITVSAGQATITCETDGASIAYTFGPTRKNEHWRLYTGPFPVERETLIRAQACRLGFKDSAIVESKDRVNSK